MARTALNGQQASKYVRIAQVAGLALAATAVLLWIGGVPGMAIEDRPESPLVVQPPPADPAPDAATPDLTSADLADMVERLEMARVQVEKPAVVAQDTPDDPEQEEEKIGDNADQPRWRYLGAIIEPTRRVALVSIEGRQRILAVGREIDGVQLLSVEPDSIVVSENGEQARLTRDERTGPSVAWVKMDSPLDRPTLPAGSTAGASLQAEPEDADGRRNLYRRQNAMDPQRAEQMRLMAQERAERRRMLRDREEQRRQREVNGE